MRGIGSGWEGGSGRGGDTRSGNILHMLVRYRHRAGSCHWWEAELRITVNMSAPGHPMSAGHYHRNYPAPGSGQVNTRNNQTCLSDAHGFHLNMIIIVLTRLLTLCFIQASIFSSNDSIVHAEGISPQPALHLASVQTRMVSISFLGRGDDEAVESWIV